MQMSDKQIFAFVEGQTDPYFYGRICESVCNGRIRYEVCQARELADAGGKQALLGFFTYLRNKSELIHAFKGKRLATIFFLDKDVDDLMRTQKRSQHVVYTEFYDAENYVFIFGNLINAAAAAASVDRQWLETRLADPYRWRRDLAERWKDWVVLCLLARLNKINAAANYGNASLINNPLNAKTDRARYSQTLRDLRNRSGLSNQEFSTQLDRITRKVETLCREDMLDIVFKGKWYASIFEAEIRTIAGGRRIQVAGISKRLIEILVVTVDFDEPWANHFKQPLRRVVASL